MPTPPKLLRSRLNKYAFALACAVSILLGIALVYQDKTLNTTRALSAIGLNLISSIVFAIVFSTLSTRTQERNLLETLDEQFDNQNIRIRDNIHETSRHYLPAKTYAATESFDEDFNRDITASLNSSRLYAFRGTSAKFVPARIRQCLRPPHQLRIVMLDPANEPVVRRRAVDRQRQAALHDRPMADLMAEVRDEVYMSLVALFDIRHSCPVEVLLTDEPVITRMELFDDSVYLSWYQGPSSPLHPFPETVRFAAGAFVYETERLALVKSFELSNRVIRFDGGHTDDDLLSWLGRLSTSRPTPEQLTIWRTQYSQFISRFEHMLEAL